MVAGENGDHGESAAWPVGGEKNTGIVFVMHQSPHVMEQSVKEVLQRIECVTSHQVILVCTSICLCSSSFFYLSACLAVYDSTFYFYVYMYLFFRIFILLPGNSQPVRWLWHVQIVTIWYNRYRNTVNTLKWNGINFTLTTNHTATISAQIHASYSPLTLSQESASKKNKNFKHSGLDSNIQSKVMLEPFPSIYMFTCLCVCVLLYNPVITMSCSWFSIVKRVHKWWTLFSSGWLMVHVGRLVGMFRLLWLRQEIPQAHVHSAGTQLWWRRLRRRWYGARAVWRWQHR